MNRIRAVIVFHLFGLPNLSPPFVVLSIVPFLPTIQPLLISIKATDKNNTEDPLAMFVQFNPASVVFRTVPPSPTAIPLFTSVKTTP